MDPVPKIEIHMGEYGGPNGDIVVMGKPGAKAIVKTQDIAGTMISRDTREGGKSENAGSLQILMLLGFVKSAPFAKTVDAFLDYCDTLEDEGIALLTKMGEVAQDLGGYSVFQI